MSITTTCAGLGPRQDGGFALAGDGAVEPPLPELLEPRVARVVEGVEAEVVAVEGVNVGRVDADGEAAVGLRLVTVRHVAAVRPAVAVTWPGCQRRREGRVEEGVPVKLHLVFLPAPS